MPSPRCTSHMLSVAEFTPMLKYMRAYYRRTLNDETKVSLAMVKLMEELDIKHECCRNMALNTDTRYDFISRRDAYDSSESAEKVETTGFVVKKKDDPAHHIDSEASEMDNMDITEKR